MSLLFWLALPDEALILVLMAAGLALILGFRAAAASMVGAVLAIALLSPFIEAGVGALPLVWQLLILLVLAVVVMRALVGLVIGRRTSSHLAAMLLRDLILMPFRMIRWLFMGGRSGRADQRRELRAPRRRGMGFGGGR